MIAAAGAAVSGEAVPASAIAVLAGGAGVALIASVFTGRGPAQGLGAGVAAKATTKVAPTTATVTKKISPPATKKTIVKVNSSHPTCSARVKVLLCYQAYRLNCLFWIGFKLTTWVWIWMVYHIINSDYIAT